MKISKKTFLAAVALTSLFVGMPAANAAEGSVTLNAKQQIKKAVLEVEQSFDDAIAAAKKEGKVMMLHFTGSDWCPPCKMLHHYILDTEKFAKYAKEKLHLVVADFTRDGEPKNAAQADSYKKLAQQFQLQGFPTIVLIDPNSGMVDTLVGLQVRTPDELIQYIDTFKTNADASVKKKSSVPASTPAPAPAPAKK